MALRDASIRGERVAVKRWGAGQSMSVGFGGLDEREVQIARCRRVDGESGGGGEVCLVDGVVFQGR